MKEYFKGYIDEIRVSKGIANYPQKKEKWKLRFAILWGAIKYFFTGKGIWLNSNCVMNVGAPGISVETWIKPEEVTPWEHWGITFDGKEANGYKDGSLV